MAIKSFADDTTSDIYHGENSKDARRIPRDVWKPAQRKMTILHNATSTQDLSALPGNRFEPLKHDRPGFFSMRINDNYRLIFSFVNGDASNVGIENFHGRKTT
jgi:proteic killer suppression protein